MSSSKYAAPLRLEPRPSRRLRHVFVFGYCGAVLCLFLTPFSLPLQSVVAALVVLDMRRAWRSQPSLGGRSLVLTWDGESRWFLREQGRDSEWTLCPDSYWHPGLVILLFRAEGKRFSRAVVLASDSLDAEIFRLLKVRLRLERYSLGADPETMQGAVAGSGFASLLKRLWPQKEK